VVFDRLLQQVFVILFDSRRVFVQQQLLALKVELLKQLSLGLVLKLELVFQLQLELIEQQVAVLIVLVLQL